MTPKPYDVTWVRLGKFYKPGGSVTLRISRLTMGLKLEVLMTVKVISLSDDSVVRQETTRIILVSNDKTITPRRRHVFDENSKVIFTNDKGISDPALKNVPVIEDAPHLVFHCKHTAQNKSMLPNRAIHIPMPHAEKNQRIEIAFQVYVEGNEVKKLKKPKGSKEIQFLSRKMSPQEKFTEFLEWQSKDMIYGPAFTHSYSKKDHAIVIKRVWRDQSGEPSMTKIGLRRASATGEEGPCITCSHFTSVFLAYWFNYAERIRGGTKIATAPQGAEQQFPAYKAVLEPEEDLEPTCDEDHSIEWTKGGKKKNWGSIVRNTSQSAKATELNATHALNFITRGVRGKSLSFRVSEGGALDHGLLVPKRLSAAVGDVSVKDDVVIWNKNKKKWMLLHRKKMPTKCSAQKSKKKWHWEAIYNYAWKKKNSEPGDIFVCGSGGHMWLIVHLGTDFNVPRKYVFGEVENSESLCKPGLYLIHASGPGPDEVLYDKYFKNMSDDKKDDGIPWKKLEKALKKWENNTATSPTGKSYKEIFQQLDPFFTKVNTEYDPSKVKGVKGLWIFNATKLTHMNGWLTEPTNKERKEWQGIVAEEEAKPEDARDKNRLKIYRKLANASLILDRGVMPREGDRFKRAEPGADGGPSKKTFKVRKLKRLLKQDTGWLDPDQVDGIPELEKMVYNDCRPIVGK